MRHGTLIGTLVTLLVICTLTSAQEREASSGALAPPTLGQVAGFDATEPTEKLDAESAMCGRPRVVETRPTSFSSQQLEEMRGLGKLVTIDPMTGQPVFKHLTDYLPAGWGKVVDTSEKVDSFGNPIVNEVPGLPGWAERDVAALRAAVEDSVAALDGVATAHRGEMEQVLGNYLGQALIRGIDIGDLVSLDHEIISSAVAQAILAQLNFYENLKLLRAEGGGHEYQPSVYGDEVIAWIEAHGSSLAEVLSTAATEQRLAKSAPSGCYTTTEFTRGMTLLSGSTVIWQVSGEDDASADVPTGFRFYFYGCDNPDDNLSVRVSTNGYLTFFEQGGGTLDGTDWGNDPITSTTDPDGYVAPNWDDLWIAPSQGSPDSVSYLTEGATGNRVFTVEWYSVSHLGPDTGEYHYFQVKLFEATGNIELHFDSLWANDSYDSATVGMEDFAGLDGDCGPNCNATNTGDTIPFNYRFAPIRPANNDCGILFSGCLAASDAPTVSSETLGATGTDVSSCGFNDIHDVWFWYHAPVTGNVTFDTCSGASFDTTLAVFNQCLGGAELGCNDDFCGASALQSLVTVGLAGGQDYFVRLAGYNGRQGTYTITATPAAFPNGDTCADAWTLGTGFLGYTSNNSGCLDDSSCAFEDTVDEWFAWTAPASGTATVTTCNPGTDFDTTLAIYDSCGGAQLACNDDTPSGLCSTIEWPTLAGFTYYIRVAGYARSYGNYELSVDYVIFADGFESGNLSAWSASVP